MDEIENALITILKADDDLVKDIDSNAGKKTAQNIRKLWMEEIGHLPKEAS